MSSINTEIPEKNLKFSIITPSFNHAQFIEETIVSVLNQNYNNFEHIIIDGGSTDKTTDILIKYPHLKWVSEKDKGQSDAINKGFRLATGDIIAWLNSDDYYEQNMLSSLAKYFTCNINCMFLYGNMTYVDLNKNVIVKTSEPILSYKSILNNPDIIRQPSCFWRKSLLNTIGYLDENLHLVMDLDYFLRIGKRADFHYIENNLSYLRLHKDGKSIKFKKRQLSELVTVLLRYGAIWNTKSYFYILKKIIKLILKK